jgi:hypothetical protein
MTDGMTQAVLSKLKEGAEGKPKASKFSKAAKQMFDAAKADDAEGFEKAFQAAIRIHAAESDTAE